MFKGLFIFIFCLWHASCRILVPLAGMEPMPPTLEVWSFNHWTTREVPTDILKKYSEPDFLGKEGKYDTNCILLLTSLFHLFSSSWHSVALQHLLRKCIYGHVYTTLHFSTFLLFPLGKGHYHQTFQLKVWLPFQSLAKIFIHLFHLFISEIFTEHWINKYQCCARPRGWIDE